MSVWLRTFSSTHQTSSHPPPRVFCWAAKYKTHRARVIRTFMSAAAWRRADREASWRLSILFHPQIKIATLLVPRCAPLCLSTLKKVITGTQNDLLFLSSPFISVFFFFFSSCDFLKRVLKHRLCLLPEDGEEVKAGYFRLLWRSFGYLLPSMLTYITASFFMLRLK